ncbi:hypothetical protein A3H03_00560 [Candidatus Kuenenbacteria bacterium RIFCSPLOWO2_12_FULL_42_13]|uniref:Amidohydrolase 3 domain-containing protein n=2 Tax=Candidatus Kueneniibacteriota TaxID=1752740 RepID=A0A1F6FZH2_9BACT|nr:MAG: hypothetical protein A3H03_00560 [Candidatus Kuenenbacteria bacterium RIFCSPLOWO2_12_FULL_42_13]
MENELSIYQPEKIVTPETGLRGKENVVLAVDQVTGEIVFRGTDEEAKQWWANEDTQQKYSAHRRVDHKGNVVLPGAVDTHNHPVLFTVFDETVDLSGAETPDQFRDDIREKAKGGAEKIMAINWRTEKIQGVDKKELDAICPDKSLVVIDPSFHGGVLNSRAIKELGRIIKPEEMKLLAGTFDKKTGRVTEEFMIRAWETAAPSVEMMEKGTEKNLETWLSQGITGVHDMEMTSWDQFQAFLQMQKDWQEKKGLTFPVDRFYIAPHIMERLFGEIKNLEQQGLWQGDLFKKMGMKLIADGAFGTHSAKVFSRYDDQDTRGEWASKIERMNKAIQMALERGVENIAIHAIGDEAVARVIKLAQKWEKDAQAIQGKPLDTSKWRIEHFELANQQQMKDAAGMGMWVSMQPNFLSDGVDYMKRLGNRTKLLCPHRQVLDSKVAMMFGSDNMPTSALYGIWAATHAPNPEQRVTFPEALAAYTIMGQRHSGREQGDLKVGERADIAVLPPDTLAGLEGPAARDWKEFKNMMAEAKKQYKDLKTIKTIMAGKEVPRN